MRAKAFVAALALLSNFFTSSGVRQNIDDDAGGRSQVLSASKHTHRERGQCCYGSCGDEVPDESHDKQMKVVMEDVMKDTLVMKDVEVKEWRLQKLKASACHELHDVCSANKDVCRVCGGKWCTAAPLPEEPRLKEGGCCVGCSGPTNCLNRHPIKKPLDFLIYGYGLPPLYIQQYPIDLKSAVESAFVESGVGKKKSAVGAPDIVVPIWLSPMPNHILPGTFNSYRKAIRFTVGQAQTSCVNDKKCKGFSYKGNPVYGKTDAKGEPVYEIWFSDLEGSPQPHRAYTSFRKEHEPYDGLPQESQDNLQLMYEGKAPPQDWEMEGLTPEPFGGSAN